MNKNRMPAGCALLLGAGFAAALGGCASSRVDASGEVYDPLEVYNRWMFDVNDKIDRYAMKPIAEGYRAVLPDPVENRVSDFFGNIGDIVITANNLLSFRLEDALSDLSRIVFNTTFGLLGLFDVATPMGLPKHTADFGLTMARWGVDSGPYFVMPFFGPSTVRDAVGFGVDVFVYDPVWDARPIALRNSAEGVRVVSRRAGLLRDERVVEEALVDRYTQIRDGYLQRRESLVERGRGAEAPSKLELDDE